MEEREKDQTFGPPHPDPLLHADVEEREKSGVPPHVVGTAFPCTRSG
jgi:hypothetical protein